MEGSGTGGKRAIVAYAHPRTQGSDRPAARAARGVSVLQRGWRHDLCRQGAGAARPRPQLSGRVRRRIVKTDALLDEVVAARGHRHRLGRRGAGAREQPDQAAARRNTTSCCATTRTTRTCSSRPTRRFRACWSRAASSATAASTPARFCRRTSRARRWRSRTGCSASARATR